jgi:hypothetical protein
MYLDGNEEGKARANMCNEDIKVLFEVEQAKNVPDALGRKRTVPGSTAGPKKQEEYLGQQ